MSVIERISRLSSNRVWRDAHCPSCGHVEDVVPVVRDENGQHPNTLPCVKCGADADLRPCGVGPPARDVLLAMENTGGWYDRGAGRHFRSKQERKGWMAREGVVAIDGDIDIEGWGAKRRAENEKADREYDAYIDKIEHAPEFAAYRQARDQGRLKHQRG